MSHFHLEKFQSEAFLASLRTEGPISILVVVTKAGSDCYKLQLARFVVVLELKCSVWVQDFITTLPVGILLSVKTI